MLRYLLAALALAAAPSLTQAQDISARIAETGLAATEATLTGTDPATRFALGGVRFLRAIEKTLQLRYRHNATFDDVGLPVLRLPVPPNPAPEPFYPGLVTDIFRSVAMDMETAREALAGAEGEFGVTIDLLAIWFDINENGIRDDGESLFEAMAATLATRPGRVGLDEMPDALPVRFDTADAAWLRAYTHLLSGVSDLVFAFDPTDVITEVLASSDAMKDLRGGTSASLFLSPDDEYFADLIAILYGAINRTPEAAHIHAARDHILAMIAENRSFWEQVAREADNVNEWIPNATQVSALGFGLPPETGTTWLAVLGDAEAVLKGELLVGHWRLNPGAGINVAKLLQDPIAIDIVTWLHGHGLMPYMERGTLADSRNMRRFERMFSGDALLFMVWFN